MNRLTGIIVIVCLAIFCSCAATKQAKKVKGAGFMSPEIYEMMEDGNREELEPARRYRAKDVDWRKYNKIQLDPVVLFTGPGAEDTKGISQEDTQKILDYFFNKLHKSIEDSPYMEVAQAPGPDTVRMQIAVVDLGESHVTMGAISTYIPQIGLITSVATMASDKPAFVGEMGIEFKMTDSSTGKIIVAGMDKRYGGKKLGKGTDSWKDVFNIIDYYVKVMGFRVCRMQERDNCERP